MSNERDLRNQDLSDVENETNVSDELNIEELDQVVGGTDPKGTPTLQPKVYLQINLEEITITG